VSDAYYTIDEVAALLKVSRNTIKRMIERRQIRAISIGAQYRIPASEWERIGERGIMLDDLQLVAVTRHTARTGKNSRR
jgi:excisionase family DNA binding protein